MLPPATKRRVLLAALALTLVLASPLDSRVVRVEILSREDVLDGRPFGERMAATWDWMAERPEAAPSPSRVPGATTPRPPAGARPAPLAPRSRGG